VFDKNCTENGLRRENRWWGIYCFASKYHRKNAIDVAEKLRNSIVLVKFDSKKCQGLSVSASFGVSAITRKGISFEDLLAQADEAL
jgi:PleD family two-component response regulator